MKIKKILTNPRVIILIVFLLISLFAINYQFTTEGATISSVEFNSSAYESGLRTPPSEISLTSKEKVLKINDQEINSPQEYLTKIQSIPKDSSLTLTTTKKEYTIIKKSEDIGLTVTKAPTSNIRKGIDLQGGTRVLLSPVGEVTEEDIQDIIRTMENRLNVYGLADVTIKSSSDLEGNKYIVVEIAGTTKDEIKEIVAKQGKFEAKISNQTVFAGGEEDIVFVCKTDGTCSRIETCQPTNEGYFCKFLFEITLSNEAAERHAQVTKNLPVVPIGSQRVLNETIDFYLDDQLVDQLQIDASLKGQKATRITISGTGIGATEKEAIEETIKNRDRLQTILITGSLPTKLNIEKIDTLSPSLGNSFINNSILICIVAILAVGLIIFLRYRSLKITIPTMITLVSEIIMILGFAALFKNNLDLAGIAGIVIAVGTGVDDQIIIVDEILYGTTEVVKQKIKRAFFVILASYATIVAAMLPLLKAGAGLLVGFALVTIVGVTVGVLVTRPAFSAIVKELME
ncbi:MAG TPA: hypothetical protein VJI68_00785 [Candidatus Nanoarchaeia archaeon]|nr:hypothetical protein [Candidatus Nanoarchaeia archaeon]